jgi:hypothetical protein
MHADAGLFAGLAVDFLIIYVAVSDISAEGTPPGRGIRNDKGWIRTIRSFTLSRFHTTDITVNNPPCPSR